MTKTFDRIKSKVVKFSNDRKFIEVPKIYRKDFPAGTLLESTGLNTLSEGSNSTTEII